MFLLFFSSVWVAEWPRFRKELLTRLTISSLCVLTRRDVPVVVSLDLSTLTGMSCIGTYGKNCKSDNVSKYRVLLVVFQLL